MSAPSVAPVKAVVRINGDILPATIFRPDSAEQREELFGLEAVVELDDAEAALAAKIVIPSMSDLLRKPEKIAGGWLS